MEQNERAKEEKEEEEEEEQRQQELWSWGAGTEGQLGTGKLQDEYLPHLLPPMDALRGSGGGPISVLSCGGAHVIALTSGGRVLTWGRGTSGQLGHGEMANSLHPKLVQSLESLVVTHVSAGWNHSGFVTDNGSVFTCGDGSFGQLGHGDHQSHSSPSILRYFDMKHVEQIACGMRHSLILLKGNYGDRLYGFGTGKRGQLGISKDKVRSICVPQNIHGLEAVTVTSIHANGDHSAALSSVGCLYTWGRGFNGNSDANIPQCLSSSLSFNQVALGWNHALLLTGDGDIYMLGGNHHGVLSEGQRLNSIKHLSEDLKETVIGKITGLDWKEVLQIAAGAEHSALVTENGLVMTWGWGEHGQLGLGSTDDQTSPQVVELGHKIAGTKGNFTEVYCGSGFTFAVRTLLPAHI